jgi:hypothetical protein
MSPDDSADGIINELASAGGTVRDTENTTTPSRDACPSIPTTAAPVTTTTDAVDAILSRHVEQHVYGQTVFFSLHYELQVGMLMR